MPWRGPWRLRSTRSAPTTPVSWSTSTSSPATWSSPGDPLFALKSDRLRRDLASGLIRPEDSTYSIRDKSTLMFIATAAGTVQAVEYLEGAFVPANTVIATVEVADSLYATADFRLRPAEYALIREAEDMTITLPNGATVAARITDVSVAADDNIAHHDRARPGVRPVRRGAVRCGHPGVHGHRASRPRADGEHQRSGRAGS